jgi:5-formyltetrahydrofolate cyclo-ligase
MLAESALFPMTNHCANQTRQTIRQKRRNLPISLQKRHAQLLARQSQRLYPLQRSQHVACYLPNDGEIDPTPLIRLLWKQQKHCYLPALALYPKSTLHFKPYTNTSPLQPNRYAILEPQAKHFTALIRLDIILLPLVAFDPHGNRLGMGGGYYDRTLRALGNHNQWKKPALWGLAHPCQQADNLPKNDWDIPLNGVITPTKLWHFQ